MFIECFFGQTQVFWFQILLHSFLRQNIFPIQILFYIVYYTFPITIASLGSFSRQSRFLGLQMKKNPSTSISANKISQNAPIINFTLTYGGHHCNFIYDAHFEFYIISIFLKDLDFFENLCRRSRILRMCLIHNVSNVISRLNSTYYLLFQ